MSDLSEILKLSKALPIEKEVILNLFCTNNYLTEKFAVFFKSHNLTAQQYNVLRILRGQNGKPANLSTIQERMVHKNSNAGRLIDKLIAKEFVDRNICEHNRRKIEVTITDKGLEKLSNVDPFLQQLEEKQVNKLSQEDKRTLKKLLEKLRE